MADNPKCPHCGSENVRKTVGTYAAKVGTVLADGAVIIGAYTASAPLFVAPAALGNFGKQIVQKLHKKMAQAVDPKFRNMVKNTYLCKDCDHTWDEI